MSAKEKTDNDIIRPTVSVVMGVYNGHDTLPDTIKSVLAQSYENWELIIIDDGSNEPVNKVLRDRQIMDERIKIVRKARNEGLTKALCAGCKLAQGKYIARIDNGDLMVPHDRLSLQVCELERDAELVIVGGEIEIVDMLNRDVYRSRAATNNGGYVDHKKPSFAHMTVMFKRAIYEAAGGYNAECYVGQDSELWPRMLSMGRGRVLSTVFAIAPMRAGSISVTRNRQQIVGQIRRRIAQVRRFERPLMNAIEIGEDVLKLMLPTELRVKLRYRRNCVYVGRWDERYRRDDNSSAQGASV